ncbi:hypothetical protein ABW20_dc0106652 [Dactylellina cionopaga]|nr:hypothetical protein ABW20_dc0106652 [Dactylellina cionopaga]
MECCKTILRDLQGSGQHHPPAPTIDEIYLKTDVFCLLGAAYLEKHRKGLSRTSTRKSLRQASVNAQNAKCSLRDITSEYSSDRYAQRRKKNIQSLRKEIKAAKEIRRHLTNVSAPQPILNTDNKITPTNPAHGHTESSAPTCSCRCGSFTFGKIREESRDRICEAQSPPLPDATPKAAEGEFDSMR